MTSIMELMESMKADADKIIGKGTKFIARQKAYAPYGYCQTCGTKLEYESPFHGALDQPPSVGGYWCPECGTWS